MRRILATLLFATPLLSYAGIPEVHTSTLNITSISGGNGSTSLDVLSDQGGATQFSTARWQAGHYVETGGLGVNYSFAMDMIIAPTAGYVITGYSISGIGSGTLWTPEKPPQANSSWKPGTARNVIDLSFQADEGKPVIRTTENVATPTPLEISAHNLSIDHAIKFNFESYTFAEAGYASWSDGPFNYYQLPSDAAANFTAPVLTVYTALAPVPEPETWGMLLAGVALIGLAKRRGKR